MPYDKYFLPAACVSALLVFSAAVWIYSDLRSDNARAKVGIEAGSSVLALDSGGRNMTGYMGRTTAYTGNLGGIAGANAKCNTAYAGSHMCTQGEALRTGTTTFDGAGWIACNIYSIEQQDGFEMTTCTTNSTSPGAMGTEQDVRSCTQWTSASNLDYGPTMSSTGNIDIATCNTSQAIHCCK